MGARIRPWLLMVCLLAALPTARAASAQQARSVLVASGLNVPLYATAPVHDTRIFAVEREGVIRVVKNGAPLATPFLDINERVTTTGEGGLLGLAFPPDYSASGLFYVYYTDNNDDSVVSRFSRTSNADVANPNSEVVVLRIDQPAGRTNHKAGTIHFGLDGFLWFATGDGGGADDPDELAQNGQSLLGKMLRIDPGPDFDPSSVPVAGQLYRIPADNPFRSTAPRDEIWAFGFRNPYRWSFDRQTGDIWIGDVGQSAREEVDFESADDPGGRNYGWDVMEGIQCHEPASNCNQSGLTLPIYDYLSVGECSVVGGFVYRGDFSMLNGFYFFGDWCTGRIWTLNPSTLEIAERTQELGPAAGTTQVLVGFGEDGSGSLLVVLASGSIYRIESVTPPPSGCGIGPELAVVLGGLAGLRRLRRRRED